MTNFATFLAIYVNYSADIVILTKHSAG